MSYPLVNLQIQREATLFELPLRKLADPERNNAVFKSWVQLSAALRYEGNDTGEGSSEIGVERLQQQKVNQNRKLIMATGPMITRIHIPETEERPALSEDPRARSKCTAIPE